MHKEEISDMIPDKLWEHPNFKKGYVLRFLGATLRVTKINRKAKRVWAQHTELVEQLVANTHREHLLDSTQQTIKKYGAPYCRDCEVPISEGPTKEGKAAAAKRDEERLSDGTIIA